MGDSVGTVEATGSLQLPLLLVLQGLGSSTLACLGVDNIVVVMMEMMLVIRMTAMLVISAQRWWSSLGIIQMAIVEFLLP